MLFIQVDKCGKLTDTYNQLKFNCIYVQ